MQNRQSQLGVSLVESLLVVVVLGLIVFLMSNIPNALGLISKSRHLSLAREIATKQIEDKRTISYINLSTGSIPINDSRLAQLPQGSGTVTVGIETQPGYWINCDTSICTNGEEAKQVVTTISWVDNSKQQTLTLQTLIGQGGINQ